MEPKYLRADLLIMKDEHGLVCTLFDVYALLINNECTTMMTPLCRE